MKIYTNNQFTGHYPVGSAAVVMAKTPAEAARRLNTVLRSMGLPASATSKDMNVFPVGDEVVRVIRDGDY